MYLDLRWLHCWNTSWWWNLRNRTATVRHRSPGSPGLCSTRMARKKTPCRTRRWSPWLRTRSLCTDPLLTHKTRAGQIKSLIRRERVIKKYYSTWSSNGISRFFFIIREYSLYLKRKIVRTIDKSKSACDI